MGKILYIINPAGNGGAGIKVWSSFKDLCSWEIDENDVIISKKPLHAIKIASTAKGYETIAAVGGDGTVNEVIEGIFINPARPTLAIIPAGTGNDIGRNVGIRSLDDAIENLKGGHPKSYDVLLSESKLGKKYSFLHTNMGFSGTRRAKPWMKRILGPAKAYYLATFLEILMFYPWDVKMVWEGGEYEGRIVIVIITNVERSGGGSMVLGLGARPTDGKMTVTIVPYKSKYDCLVNKFPKTPTGKIINEPGVKFFQTEKISIDCNPPSELDIDGDLFSSTPVTIEILPQAIKILSPDH